MKTIPWKDGAPVEAVAAAVEKCNSNIAGAARLLGINRSTLYYRMRKHGLEYLLPTKVVPSRSSSGDAN